jgi:hypothetical protein
MGPPVLGEIYAEFQRLQDEKEDEPDYNEPYPKP